MPFDIDKFIKKAIKERTSPCDDKELEKLNSKHNFSFTPVSDLLFFDYLIGIEDVSSRDVLRDYIIGDRRDEKRSDGIQALLVMHNEQYEWHKAFSRYKLSAEWKERLDEFVSNDRLDKVFSSSPFVGQKAIINESIEESRSCLPEKGTEVRIVDLDYRFDPEKQYTGEVFLRVEYTFPCKLSDGGLYVSEQIIDPYAEKQETTSLMDEYGASYLIWQREEYGNFAYAYYKPSELLF
jgi:hypothetical protein